VGNKNYTKEDSTVAAFKCVLRG